MYKYVPHLFAFSFCAGVNAGESSELVHFPSVVDLESSVKSRSNISTRIINGQIASVNDYPSLAAIAYDPNINDSSFQLYCGATILDNWHVLTAAHCVQANSSVRSNTAVAVQLGRRSEYSEGYIPKVKVAKYYIHPEYVNSSSLAWPNDIAIIQLRESLDLSSQYFSPLASNSDSSLYRSDAYDFMAVGFGYVGAGGALDDDLMETTLTYKYEKSCTSRMTDKQLCMDGEIDADSGFKNSICSGDSGGPLYWFDGGEYIQVGVASFGPSSCGSTSASFTSAYTEVSDYRGWIADVLNGKMTPDHTIVNVSPTGSSTPEPEPEPEPTPEPEP
ncbi:serine protease, partial [Vibrio sp. qd031]|uniref:S1 family peptidase n=1 Tax=Vibrio sp. qd031 TaxID=1603038 RepID=UPI000A11B3BC